MSAHLRYLATIEATERRKATLWKLDEIVRRVDDDEITPEVAMVKIAAIEARRPRG